jgi:hypothetical protein
MPSLIRLVPLLQQSNPEKICPPLKKFGKKELQRKLLPLMLPLLLQLTLLLPLPPPPPPSRIVWYR